MEEKPVPTEARQRTFGPSAGQAALILSEEKLLRFGPRHCGQSAADAPAGPSRHAKKTKPRFMGFLLPRVARIFSRKETSTGRA
jgi:hypothetical protein